MCQFPAFLMNLKLFSANIENGKRPTLKLAEKMVMLTVCVSLTAKNIILNL